MQDDSKLTRSKQRWAAEKRALVGRPSEAQLPDSGAQRLPPGQTLVKDWPVLDLGQQPDVTVAKFRLDIDGFCRHPLSLTLADLLALPQSESVSDMHCVTSWSRYDNHWRGVAASALLSMVEPKDEAQHVLFHAHDGYTTNVRLDQFDQPDVFLVHEWEGRPISREHGGPVRVLIPRLYLWKSPKWVRRIELAARDRRGFWETRGYHNNADPWAEQRYSE